jgi:hypothetical protein
MDGEAFQISAPTTPLPFHFLTFCLLSVSAQAVACQLMNVTLCFSNALTK